MSARQSTPPGTSQQLELLVDSVVDYAILLLDLEGHVTSWNRGAARIKGYDASEIIGEHFSRFYTADDRAADHPAAVLRSALDHGRYEEEGWRVRKDGTRFWANVVITPLAGPDGQPIAFGKVIRDLTTRREAEELLRGHSRELEQLNRELDRFAAVAAHDLQEPLRTIAGFHELLDQQADRLDASGRAWLDHIGQAAEGMQRLVDGLLAYARSAQRPAASHPVDVGLAVGRAVTALHARIAERGAVIVDELAAGTIVSASDHDLHALLINLMSNAVKFGAAEQPRVTVRSERVGDAWRIVVSDDGDGVAPEDQRRIFEAFQRSPSALGNDGTGLGLAIVHRIIERRDGALGLESTAGAGSSFWFTLPAA